MARIPTNTPAGTASSAEDDVLIREIDEAVREDAVLEFLRKHGLKLLGVIVVALAALGGYMLWHNAREAELEQQSEALISALDYADQRDFETASEKVVPLLSEDTSAGARAAARFVQAGAALEMGDTKKATTLYKAIAAAADTPPVMRDLARVRQVSLNFDRMKPADVIAQLGSLAKPGSAFFGSAGELVAMAHMESGDNAAAGKLFAAIAKDEDQPESLRSRARQMAGLLGVDAVVDVTKLLKDQGITTSDGAGSAAAAAE